MEVQRGWGGTGPGGQEGKGQSERNHMLFVHCSPSPSERHRAGTLKGFSCDYLGLFLRFLSSYKLCIQRN